MTLCDFHIGVGFLAVIRTRVRESVVGGAAGEMVAFAAVDDVDVVGLRVEGGTVGDERALRREGGKGSCKRRHRR